MPTKLLLAAALALAVVISAAVTAGSHQGGSPPPRYDADSLRFTFAVVPDTQYLFDDDRGDSEPVTDAFDWIVANRANENIAFVAGLGDVTQDGTAPEVARADQAYRVLDRGGVPYSSLAGNHDINSSTTDQRGDSPYLQAFGPQRFRRDPTFKGASPDGYNSYHVFHAAGRDWLVLALDWRLSDAGFAWTQSVLDAHPHTPTILTTHELLNNDSGTPVLSGYGQSLWNRLIRHNDQVFLTVNGHFWPVGRTTMKNDFGHDVQLNLADYQDQYYGGAGMIRTYAFDLARKTIDVSTFAPWVMDTPDADRAPLAREMLEKSDAASRFSLPLDFDARFGPAAEPPEVATPKLDVPGTVALWRPQKTAAGGVADASGHGNDLTPVTLSGGGSLGVTDQHRADAPSKHSLRFDGSRNHGTYLSTGPNAPLNTMTFKRGYTIEAIVKLPAGCCSNNAWMGLLGQMGTGRDAGKTQNDPDEGVVEFNLSGGAEPQWAVWPTNREDNTTAWGHLLEGERWTHLAIVNDGRFTDMYIDGSLNHRDPFSPAIGLSSTGKPWTLGASDYANVVEQTFHGWVGDVRIVDHALQPSEFLTSREAPRARAVRAELHRRSVGIDVAGSGRGTLRAAVEVPWTGQRIELGTRSYRAGDDVDFSLPEDIDGNADGARVEVWLDGAPAVLHLNS